MSITARIQSFVGGAIGAIASLLLFLVFAFFMIAQCVGDAKGLLSFVGLGPSDDREQVELREIRPNLPADVRLVRSLVTMLQAAGIDPNSVQGAIVVSEDINALTFGNEAFLFFEGLHRVPDDVLDAIMAHEVAHVVHRHSLQSADRADTVATWTSVLGRVLPGVDEAGARQATSWAIDLTMPSHSRAQELEADRTAVDILKSSGYRTDATSVMAKALEWMQQNTEDSDYGFFSSHPSLSERVDRLRR